MHSADLARDIGCGPNRDAPAVRDTLYNSYAKTVRKPFILPSAEDDKEKVKVIGEILQRIRRRKTRVRKPL